MMRDVSERILINSEKSIDILQGIIVFVSWYHPHVFWAAQVTNLLHLAMAMTIEMGIDRSPQLCGDFKQSTVKAVHTQPSLTRVPRLEDHRTLAGVYFLTGMLASSFKKIDAMPFTKYLGDALNMLEQACEFESDMFAVQMVRLQHLSEETYTMEAASAPTHMYVRAFNADLERLRKEDPCKNVDNVFLKMQYLTAEILVWELSLIDLLENHAKPLRSHLEDLYHCVEAIKAFIDIFFTIPSSMYLLVPFMTFGQFAHAFIVLVKLASLEVEGWDMKDMHGRLDFGVVIEEAASRFDSAAKSSPDGMVVNNECFGKWAHRMRWMKQVYEGKFSQGGGDSIESTDRGTGTFKTLAGTLKGPGGAKVSVLRQNDDEMPAPADTAAGGVQQATPPDDVLSGDFFNYLDEGFWQSFGTDLDLGFDNMPIGQGVTPAVQL